MSSGTRILSVRLEDGAAAPSAWSTINKNNYRVKEGCILPYQVPLSKICHSTTTSSTGVNVNWTAPFTAPISVMILKECDSQVCE